jgi:hypothetical protein
MADANRRPPGGLDSIQMPTLHAVSKERPSIAVAVVLRRLAKPSRWEDWRFEVTEVLPDQSAFGDAPRLLRDDGAEATWLHPGFAVELFTDEAEGYHLNLRTEAPVWFVLWRLDESDASRAAPHAVTLSYNEAARWLDAQERIDNVPLPPDVRHWLQAYTDEHYKPEPRQRKRPASFQRPEDRR